jgi:LysM repeat protein
VTNEPGQDDYGAVCPYLGLADDADSHATYATEAHRCFRLPNPTRIATGHQETYCLGAKHVSCPVYLGEGVPGAGAQKAAAGAALVPGRAPQRPEPAAPTVRGPRQGEGGPKPPREREATARAPRRPSPGAIGPRPRAGGISLPVATIGLFSLAIVVVALAFAINKLSGGSSGSDIPQVAKNQTATAAAAGAGTSKTQTVVVGTRPAGSTTPGAGQTTTGGQTPGAGQTPGGSQTPGAGAAGTYTVKSGDTCSGIAAANNIDLQTLLDLNKMTVDQCSSLAVGQVLKLK